MPQPVPRIMLSAAGSGAGKTTMTAALLSALCSRGLQVQGWKCGPDYIDPMFHSHITGRPAYHADPFFLSEQFFLFTFIQVLKPIIISPV